MRCGDLRAIRWLPAATNGFPGNPIIDF